MDLRRHITADRRIEKQSLHLSQFMVLLHGLLYLSAISEATLLYTIFVVAPIPPENMRVENDPCSTSLILSS